MNFTFVPTVGQNQTIAPTMDGIPYQASFTWNVFGQRWYYNLFDTSGTLLLCRALVSSDDPSAIASLSWDTGIVTVTAAAPHFLTLGEPVSLTISGATPAAYNGTYECLPTGPTTFTYALADDPGQQIVTGTFGGTIDLTAGLFETSTTFYYANRSQIVVTP